MIWEVDIVGMAMMKVFLDSELRRLEKSEDGVELCRAWVLTAT